MVKEYIKKYSLYSAAYHEHQAHLLSQYQEKKKQIEEYLQEIKDVIIDDVRDSMRDRRQSIDACMTVTAPKTPGMTIRRTKRKIQEKKVEIDLNSPDTSISFANIEVQGSARFTGCTSRLDSTNNTITPTNTMTPNRTQSAFKQTRLQSLLEQKSVLNLTPTSGRATRLTRAKVKLLEQSLINSTINSMQSVNNNTPSLKTKLLDRYDEDITATPSNGSTTPQNRTKSTVPHDESTSATPQNKTAVGVTFALGATPIQEEIGTPTQEESGTPTHVEFPAANSTMMQPGTPAANSTMMQPGTPAAPFGANITLITNTPKQSTPVAGKAEALVVSSPIGPIATSGTPTRNQAIDTEKNTSDWVVSTGKRKFSNGKSTVSTPSPATTPRGTPGPASTPVIKRLQLSTYQPSPVPIATPAEKAPALLSLTIPGTPTPENVSASLFPSPVEEVGVLPGTPRLEGNPDVTRTPNMNDIQAPGALGRTPGLSRVKQVLGTLNEVERGRSGDDLVFLGESAENNDDEVEVGLGEVEVAEGSESNGVEDEEKVEIPVVTHDEEKVSIDESPEETEDMETCENVESESDIKSTEIIDGDTSMRSDPDQKNVSMASEQIGNVSIEHTDAKTESETEPEAMDVAGIPKTTDDNTNAPSEEIAAKFFESPKVLKEEVNLVTKPEDSGDKETVSSEPELQTDNLETKTDNEISLEEELQAAEVGDGNESNQLFESCDEGGEKESEVNVVDQFADHAIEEEEVEEEEPAKTEEEETPAPPTDPKTPRPVRQTRSSRNKKHAESKQKTEEKGKKPKRVGVDKKVMQSGGIEVGEGLARTRTRTRSGKESDEQRTSSQGTVKKIAADYENISKKTVKEAGISRIPTLSSKNQARDDRLDMSKREREESEADSMEDKTTNSADESIHLKKRMKDNAGVPRNPQNLVTSVMSFVNKPVVVVKTAKELEEEKKEAAKKKIEEKEVKAQQVLNKKKQRENELRLKRIEKDKRMKQAKQNKEDEAKKKKADLEERMRKKDETSVKEREMLAKKEDEKRQRELKRQEQAEQRRKQAEKTRELKKKKLQEEAEERKVDALKRKQELEALKVRELEKHRMEEEARMEEQKKLEAEEHEKRQKAQEERRKLEEEIEKKKTTPSRMGAKTKLNLTGAGTLLGATPTPRPPPRTNKHAASKIPTKAGRAVEEAVPGSLLIDLEEASNVCSDNEEVRSIPAPIFAKDEPSVDKPTSLTKTTSGLLTPIAQAPESVDSPSSAASSRIQSYMKNKLLSLGQTKTKRNLGSRMESISEGNSMKASPLSYDPRDNYKIDDIESGDDTDDESKPKRTMPSWARNKISLNDSLRKQFSGIEKHSAKTIFGPFPKTADLDQLFGTVNRYTSRTSSAHWSAPPSTGNLDFSILTEDEINHANNILLKYK
ncbi:uncharacterized protein LOC134822403 isoform X2 [Bolinopsis microptera]|uniref:uncharacterized protein LOC134822403 isoform X2 n=1 Tax=Bolinopsis microptera TaxID=2820187 RepID=UPI003078F3EC